MRRSIDDQPITESELPPGAEDALPVSWAIAICDDYDDATPRVVLTVEDLGRPGTGLVAEAVSHETEATSCLQRASSGACAKESASVRLVVTKASRGGSAYA